MMHWWCTDEALMIYWWCTDDALMMHLWCTDDALMMRWLFTDDVLLVPWWCPDDAMMMHQWCTHDALMMHWWCTDDALSKIWCTGYDMMHIGQVSDLHGRFYGGRINGDKTWRQPTTTDRVNIEQSASGRWTGRVLQYITEHWIILQKMIQTRHKSQGCSIGRVHFSFEFFSFHLQPLQNGGMIW